MLTAGLQLGGDRRHGRDLHEVEIVEQPDPGDPEEHVEPLEHAVQQVARRRRDSPSPGRPRSAIASAEADEQHQVQIFEELPHFAPPLSAQTIVTPSVLGLKFSSRASMSKTWGGGRTAEIRR